MVHPVYVLLFWSKLMSVVFFCPEEMQNYTFQPRMNHDIIRCEYSIQSILQNVLFSYACVCVDVRQQYPCVEDPNPFAACSNIWVDVNPSHEVRTLVMCCHMPLEYEYLHPWLTVRNALQDKTAMLWPWRIRNWKWRPQPTPKRR